MGFLLAAVLAGSIDGNAAYAHASALASLGPHTWGSPRTEAAVLYVADRLRAAGLGEVELQRFESEGVQGTNVIATLRAPGDEFVLVSAHHDTAPGSPGAYDDSGGVAILIELARVLAAQPSRTRSVVFASFDGEEAETLGRRGTAGSRAYLERLGARARSLVAAVAIEMSGWGGGTPLVHPIAYRDLRGPAGTVIAPGWLVQAALSGSRQAGAPFGVGDARISWLYQPAVRCFRVRLHGDDLAFLQAGRPALLISDSSPSAFYPDYHRPSDVAERLDPRELERMGRAVLGALRALDRAPAAAASDPDWFAAFGRVIGRPWLLGLGAAAMAPALASGLASGATPFGLRLLQAALFGVLLWRAPVPALWLLALPNALLPLRRRRYTILLALLPALLLVALGGAAWWRGAVNGVWLQPWEIAVAGLALLLALFALPPGRGTRRRPARPAREPARARPAPERWRHR
jgi:hypothetical protein